MAAFAFDPEAAVEHLRRADPVLAAIVDRIGPFALALKPVRSVFAALAEAIFYQQLSTKAAETIFGRLCADFPRGVAGLTPDRLLALSDSRIRAAGLSQAKLAALRDLARRSRRRMHSPLPRRSRRLHFVSSVTHGARTVREFFRPERSQSRHVQDHLADPFRRARARLGNRRC